ncbi:MAG: molybdopterin-dependent oxidoreductase, partial [Stenotrophomonas sp.]
MPTSESTTGQPQMRPHSSHWGAFSAAWDGTDLSVQPHPQDPDPNPIVENLRDALRHPIRVARPMVRKGWLDNGPGPDPRRGSDDYVEMEWDEVLDLLANELRRVEKTHGCEAIFGGSYGWSSAGRFHHAQSQVHRFLNTAVGGYVRSVNTYSAGAAAPLLPHVIAPMEQVARQNVTLEQLAEHTDVVLAFGGMALKNSRVASGGVSRHTEKGAMLAAALRGCRFVNISPLRSDLPPELHAEWIAAVPMTDTALMLGLVHQLHADGQLDRDYI